MGLVLDTVTVEGNATIEGNIIKGGATISLPTSTDTIVLLTEAQTLTNKTLSGLSNTFSNIATSTLTGTLQATQFPALTGHITTTAGSLATTIGTGVVTNAMLAGSITFAKLVGTDITAVGTLANLTVTNPISGSVTGNAGTATLASTVTTNANLTGPITSSGNATSVTTNAITNAMLAQVATQTFKGRTTAATGNVEDLTATQATAILNVFGGDAGSGGVKGLVPATIAGDATKYLKGDGTWGSIASGGTVTSVSVTTANGVSGSVATATTTPAITLTLGAITPSSVAASGTVTGSNLSGSNTGDQTITLTGDITGSGTGSFATTYNNIVPATKGGAGATNGILKANGSGVVSAASSGSDYELPLSFTTGLTRSTNTITVNTSQNITILSNLTSNGIVTTSGSNGTLSVTGTTGSNNVVLATSPTLVTPVLGVATATRVNNQSFLNNFSTASQAIAAVTRTYITGSRVVIPANKLQIGTMIRWTFDVTKTGAGTAAAASFIDIAFGTNGTTGDTARVTLAKPAGTGVVDNGLVVVTMICRGPLSAAGIVVGHMNLTHNLSTTGIANIPCVNVTTVSGAFNVTTPTFVGLCMTTATNDAYTIQQVITETWNL